MTRKHLIATIIFSVILHANGFSYKDAKNWGKKFPECKGKHQSPINIPSSTTMKFQNIIPNLKFTNFNKLPKNMTMKNTGHTVEVTANWSGKRPTFTGGPLKGNYVFEKATFHWTEKPLNLGMMELEMHLIFYKKDLKSFKKAETQKGGLAVFQIRFEVRYNTIDVITVFEEMEKSLHKVQSQNSVAVLSPISLTSFLSISLPPLDFYEGSLDYPPCSESATWFVVENKYGIVEDLVNEFRKIKLAEGDKSNLRPAQALNGRQPKRIESYIGKDE